MNHAERYEYLVNKMAAIRWRGSDLDASYHAALFLMASHPALFEKMDRYLCPDGIDFTKMMRKEEFEATGIAPGRHRITGRQPCPYRKTCKPESQSLHEAAWTQ